MEMSKLQYKEPLIPRFFGYKKKSFSRLLSCPLRLPSQEA